MRLLLAAAVLAATLSPATAQYYGTGSNPNDHYVSGHTNSNGSYTAPHYQTNPNGSTSDNYGAYGNYNPHTGRTGRGY